MSARSPAVASSPHGDQIPSVPASTASSRSHHESVVQAKMVRVGCESGSLNQSFQGIMTTATVNGYDPLCSEQPVAELAAAAPERIRLFHLRRPSNMEVCHWSYFSFAHVVWVCDLGPLRVQVLAKRITCPTSGVISPVASAKDHTLGPDRLRERRKISRIGKSRTSRERGKCPCTLEISNTRSWPRR
jgi:hypothetical protein